MKLTVIIAKSPNGFGAHVPELPGCVAGGRTQDEVLRLIREAVALHIVGMRKAGLAAPVEELADPFTWRQRFHRPSDEASNN